VILAAGASTRMGTPKALLATPSGRPFAASILRALLGAGVEHVVIVTGHYHGRAVESVLGDGPPVMPRFARNLQP